MKYEYQCPHCTNSPDYDPTEPPEIDVTVTTGARLVFDEGGDLCSTDDTASACQDHVWDEDSPMECRACFYVGPAREFKT